MSRTLPARPRAHVHAGTVEVEALWFDPSSLGETEARGRVLAVWTPGAQVHALEGGWLLRWPVPRLMACDQAPGLPLIQVDGVLLSAPLSPTERERLAPPHGSVLLVHAGRVRVHPLSSTRRVDVSDWLDVSGWDVVAVEGLGAPPPPVVVLAPVPPPSRSVFGVGAPSAEAEAMHARMQGLSPPVRAAPPPSPALLDRVRAWWRGRQARPGSQLVVARTSSPRLARLRAWWRQETASVPQTQEDPGPPTLLDRLLHAVFSRLRLFRDEESPAPPQTPPRSPPPPPRPPPGPGLLSRFNRWLATSTPLGKLLAQRKAEYVQRLFDLFEEGNLEEALRHAIPLSQGMSESARVSLGLPGPRETLAIQTRSDPGGGSIFGGGEEVYRALRERYRDAMRKLEREGRIEEAAFVLAELLQESEAAVSFLERHGRMKLAAELAEGRRLPVGLVVRQWMLARDVGRAVDIARRTGAFADAVPRLERTHPAEARVLRLLWGEVLAQAGDYARAVDVVWPLEDARRLCRAWLEQGVEAGGVGGARLLARLAVAFPDRFEGSRARVLALLEPEGHEAAVVREAFGQALQLLVEQGSPPPETALVLLRPTLRALMRDQAAGWLPTNPWVLQTLVRLTADPVLKQDLPTLTLPSQSGRKPFVPPLSLSFDVGEGGPWPIRDAVALSDGRLLVALGEAGARLVSEDGRCLAHFDVPCFSLVLSHTQERALALARRGELWRVSRLDLSRRRAEPWCDTRLDAFALAFDGSLWFIAVEDTVMAVDVLAAQPRALWRVSQLGGKVMALAAGPEGMSFVTLSPEHQLERWVYVLPDPTLRSRQLLSLFVRDSLRSLCLLASGEVMVMTRTALCRLGPSGGSPTVETQEPPSVLFERVFCGRWEALVRTGSSVQVELMDLTDRSSSRKLATFHFADSPPVSLRFHGRFLVLFDGVGRLIRVELERGEVRRVVLR